VRRVFLCMFMFQYSPGNTVNNATSFYIVGKAVARTVFIGEADQVAGFVVMVAEGVAQRIGASCRQTVLAVFVGGFGLDCYRRNISDDLEKGSRSSEKQKQHDYRTHATAEFEVSCGLRLVVGSRPNLLLFDSKNFSYFFSFNHACYGLLSFF